MTDSLMFYGGIAITVVVIWIVIWAIVSTDKDMEGY